MLNTITLGNCYELIKEIPNESIDLIVTDPPYCVGTTSNGQKGKWLDNNIIIPFFDTLFKEFYRVLKNNTACYINTDWRTYPLLYPIIQQYFDIKNLIVWDYEWIKAGSHYRFSHEFIIYCVKGDCKRKFSASERDVWRIKPINFTSKNKLHNAQKPIELVKKMIINSSNVGDIVLDCFSGSGTTCVAAKELDRQFLGIEIDAQYHKISLNRLKELSTNEQMKMEGLDE
jgi:site-specific DNA-methyltransferase (adenine-specific)